MHLRTVIIIVVLGEARQAFHPELHPIHMTAFEKCLEGSFYRNLNVSLPPPDNQIVTEIADRE